MNWLYLSFFFLFIFGESILNFHIDIKEKCPQRPGERKILEGPQRKPLRYGGGAR
jgi:hypothetical protein